MRNMETTGDHPTEWAEEFWTGERGRICICHGTRRYSGCNNTMGTKAGFRDIKEVSQPSAGISKFIGGLVHYMKEVAKEDEQEMIENGTPDHWP